MVIVMKVRLGYACISKTLEGVTSSTSYPYTKFVVEQDFLKLDRIIKSNLEALEEIIDYNIANDVHFFRISSKIVPFATHLEVDFDYGDPYLEYYKRIGDKIRKSAMRVDVHPDQFCVLNSTRQEVVGSSFEILEYHHRLLSYFGIDDKVIVLHVGGNTFGKKKSLSRFVNQFQKLPLRIRNSIVIENDDKIFGVNDCLYLSKNLSVPVVLDYHHYLCNPSEEDFFELVGCVFNSWKNRGVPKVHFSSPKNNTKKEFRSHHDYIDCDKFIQFIEMMKVLDRDFDVMIEAKAKDEALFRLIRELKYKTNYQFLDETTFIV